MDNLQIHERTAKYQLPDDEKAALDRLLYEQQAGLLKVEQLNGKAKKFFEDAVACRGTGLQDADKRISSVLKHFRQYNQEYGIANNQNRGAVDGRNDHRPGARPRKRK